MIGAALVALSSFVAAGPHATLLQADQVSGLTIAVEDLPRGVVQAVAIVDKDGRALASEAKVLAPHKPATSFESDSVWFVTQDLDRLRVRVTMRAPLQKGQAQPGRDVFGPVKVFDEVAAFIRKNPGDKNAERRAQAAAAARRRAEVKERLSGTKGQGLLGLIGKEEPKTKLTFGPVESDDAELRWTSKVLEREGRTLGVCGMMLGPRPRGTVTMAWPVDEHGIAGEVTVVAGPGSEAWRRVAQCFSGRFEQIAMPTPQRAGAVVRVQVTGTEEEAPGARTEARAPPRTPTTAADQTVVWDALVADGLDVPGTERVLRARTRAFAKCAASLPKGASAGFDIRFAITTRGRPEAVVVTGSPPAAQGCIAGLLPRLRFPKAKTRTEVSTRVTLHGG